MSADRLPEDACAEPAAGPPPILRICAAEEPARPLDTFAVHFCILGQWRTAITRAWEDRERPTCGGLCDTPCTFREGVGVCVVPVESFVPLSECEGYASRLPRG